MGHYYPTIDDDNTNIFVSNDGRQILTNFNFMLRVEGIYDVPCKAIRAFTRENEYEFIKEGGLNDYVHMRRRQISKPFQLVVERYAAVDYVDPLPNGAELTLPVILMISNYVNSFGDAKRTYTFTGCSVMSKEFGALDAEKGGLLTETVTIGYREMLCVDLPWRISMDDDEYWNFYHPDGKRHWNHDSLPSTFQTAVFDSKGNLSSIEQIAGDGYTGTNAARNYVLSRDYTENKSALVSDDEAVAAQIYKVDIDSAGNPVSGVAAADVKDFKSEAYDINNGVAPVRAMTDTSGIITLPTENRFHDRYSFRDNLQTNVRAMTGEGGTNVSIGVGEDGSAVLSDAEKVNFKKKYNFTSDKTKNARALTAPEIKHTAGEYGSKQQSGGKKVTGDIAAKYEFTKDGKTGSLEAVRAMSVSGTPGKTKNPKVGDGQRYGTAIDTTFKSPAYSIKNDDIKNVRSMGTEMGKPISVTRPEGPEGTSYAGSPNLVMKDRENYNFTKDQTKNKSALTAPSITHKGGQYGSAEQSQAGVDALNGASLARKYVFTNGKEGNLKNVAALQRDPSSPVQVSKPEGVGGEIRYGASPDTSREFKKVPVYSLKKDGLTSKHAMQLDPSSPVQVSKPEGVTGELRYGASADNSKEFKSRPAYELKKHLLTNQHALTSEYAGEPVKITKAQAEDGSIVYTSSPTTSKEIKSAAYSIKKNDLQNVRAMASDPGKPLQVARVQGPLGTRYAGSPTSVMDNRNNYNFTADQTKNANAMTASAVKHIGGKSGSAEQSDGNAVTENGGSIKAKYIFKSGNEGNLKNERAMALMPGKPVQVEKPGVSGEQRYGDSAPSSQFKTEAWKMKPGNVTTSRAMKQDDASTGGANIKAEAWKIAPGKTDTSRAMTQDQPQSTGTSFKSPAWKMEKGKVAVTRAMTQDQPQGKGTDFKSARWNGKTPTGRHEDVKQYIGNGKGIEKRRWLPVESHESIQK